MIPLVFTTAQRKVNDLIPLSINPRKISEAKMGKLIDSLKKFNLVDLPVVDFDNTLISGPQRMKALQAIGRGEEVIDVRIANRKMTQSEVKAYNVLANTHFGEFDFDILEESFGDMDFGDMGLDNLKMDFDAFVMSDLQDPDHKETDNTKTTYTAEEDDFEVSEVEEIKTDIVFGDLFELIDNNDITHRLLCGDSTISDSFDRVTDNEKVDMVFTDPPYEIEDSFSKYIVSSSKEDCHIFIMTSDKKCIDIINNNYAIFKKFFAVDFRQARLVSNNQPMTRVDLIVELNKGKGKFNNLFDGFSTLIQCSKIHSDKVEMNYGHKQAKKIELPFSFIAHYSNESELILDCFGGSGTTLIASCQLKRRCALIEFEPKYCQAIINRFLDFNKNGVVKKIK